MSLFRDSNIVRLSHELLAEVVVQGDHVVDATAGKGRDTVFLAKIVGDQGRVYSFDSSLESILACRKILHKEGLRDIVKLFHTCHSRLEEIVQDDISASIFNLGYFPGGSAENETNAKTTIQALESIIDLLNPGGRVVVVYYTEHLGGREEADAVLSFAGGTDPMIVRSFNIEQSNRPKSPGIVVFDRVS